VSVGRADSEKRRGLRPVALLVICFLLHALPFLSRPALIGGDEPHYALMAHAIAVDRTLDLEEAYRQVEAGSQAAGRKAAGRPIERHLVTHGARRVFSHPLGLPVLAAPFLAVLDALAPGAAPDLVLGGLTLTVTFAALLAGWELLLRLLGNRRDATVLTIAVYFSTALWYYSRTFYTEPYIWAFVVLAIFCVARGRWLGASLLLGLACVVKETAVFLALPLVAYIWKRYGAARAAWLSPFPAIFAVVYLVKNWLVYGRLLETFQPYRIGNPLAGALGTLFDLQHGLLVFAPVLALALAGWVWPGRRRQPLDDAGAYTFAAFLLFFAVTAGWVAWRGGSCYGPRLMVPAVVATVLPLCWFYRHSATRPVPRAGFSLLVVVGFAIQWCAVTQPFAAFWEISLPRLLAAAPLGTLTGLAVGGLLLRFAPEIVARTFPDEELRAIE
jgi:hypothetical protein